MAMNPAEAVEPTPDTESTAEDAAETGSTYIELEIRQDGTFMVNLESGEQEAAEQSGSGEAAEPAEPAGTPAKDLKEALKIIESIAKQVMGAAPTPEAQAQENAGYAQEMAK